MYVCSFPCSAGTRKNRVGSAKRKKVQTLDSSFWLLALISTMQHNLSLALLGLSTCIPCTYALFRYILKIFHLPQWHSMCHIFWCVIMSEYSKNTQLVSLTTCLGMLVSYCRLKFLLSRAILQSNSSFHRQIPE